jgi:hypothetical protein
LRQKAIVITILLLMSVALLVTASISVQGQTNSVSISGVTSNGITAPFAQVDFPGTAAGTIPTFNGQYKLYFNDQLVSSGTAQGYTVNANFTFPALPAGDYFLTLVDTTTDANYSYPMPVVVSYDLNLLIPSAPAQVYEGNSISFNVTVKGGDPNHVYNAEITVSPPTALGLNFTKTISITTNSLGVAQTLVSYPDLSYSPTGATTGYVGQYTAYFNASQDLAQRSFPVGFTDATSYHRGDVVRINAIGYQPSQNTSVAITLGGTIVFSQSVLASGQGVVATTWTIPNSAVIGTYDIAITPLTTPSKALADVQTLQIAGYSASIKTVNLAGEAVPNLLVQAVDQITNAVYNGTTNANGVATISLEKGSYTINVYWNQIRVSQRIISVTGSATFPIVCQLTDLTLRVQDKNGVGVPFVNLNMTFQYTNPSGTQNGLMTGQTDTTGTYTFTSILPGVTYTVSAYKYSKVFSTYTASNLPVQSSSQATILVPEETISISIVDYNYAAIPNARVTLIEQASGVFYSLTTDNNGNLNTAVTFGQYKADIFTSDNVLLNSTVVNALTSSSTLIQIRNVLYDLHVSIQVVDLFGTPISGVTVQLARTGMTTQQATTQGNGIASFNSVIGGSTEVTAIAPGNSGSFTSETIYIDSPTTIQVQMNRFISIAGMTVDSSLFTVVIIIVIAIIALMLAEIYHKTGFRLRRKKS